MRTPLKITAFLASFALAGLAAGVLAGLVAYVYLAPTLPEVEAVRDVKLQVPLRIFTRDGRLIAEFGDKRRIPLTFGELPARMVQAIISAEDDRFFEHPGVDYQGLMRAVIKVAQSGGRRTQGGSTITMQLARNLFLIPDKTYKRKLQEIFLALKIEREISKEEILALYLNKIFLGQRAYGVGAAAQVYFGKPLADLTLGETATIAGLPQSPSNDNPVRSPERAMARRAYVLRRMLELGYIDEAGHDAAAIEPMRATLHAPTVAVRAPYVAEMVRAEIEERLGRDAINEGYRVVTSIDSGLQEAAVRALRFNLHEYDYRHGFRGPVARIDDIETLPEAELRARLDDIPRTGELLPAAVRSVDAQSAGLLGADGVARTLDLAAVAWARRYLDDETVGPEVSAVDDVLDVGDVVYLAEHEADGVRAWRLSQRPNVQGAMIALDPRDGAIAALTGGYDFFYNKFNRAVQARRQPGSSFKPFVYSAALDYGLTPATVINDAPVVFEDAALDDVWRPKNYSGAFGGPTRLREALVRSRNLVSIRLLNRIGIGHTVNYLQAFGFEEDRLPRDLSLALGSAAVTPLELASAYAIFANGGFAVEPYFIDRIENAGGEVVFQTAPASVCNGCVDLQTIDDEASACEKVADVMFEPAAPRVLSAQNAYMMTTMMQDVVRRGTGAKASQLGRNDLAGKTGTTNDHRDAWFSGFNRHLAAITWVGFDKERPLGRGEAGASTALPGWMHFMGHALAGVEEAPPIEPEGLVTVRISSESGLLASANASDAIMEIFLQDNVPMRAEYELEFGKRDEEDEYDPGDIF